MRGILFFLLSLLLAGCMKYQPPSRVPAGWQSPIAQGMYGDSPRCFSWWKPLNDCLLNELMRCASLRNYDLQIARDKKEDSCAAWMALAAEVAKNYSELRGLQMRLTLIDQHIASQKEMVELTKGLMTSGFVGIIDLIQAEEHLDQLTAKKPQLEILQRQKIYHISTLLGNAPGDLCAALIQPGVLPELPCEMPIGSPYDFLARKFDLSHVVKKGKVCQGSQAFYQYEKAAMESLEEVENTLTAFYYTIESNRNLNEAYQKSREAYQQMHALYERGLKSYIEVLVIQQNFLTNEDAFVESKVELVLRYIDLYKALYLDKVKI